MRLTISLRAAHTRSLHVCGTHARELMSFQGGWGTVAFSRGKMLLGKNDQLSWIPKLKAPALFELSF
jgi:hypothetical protein